MREMIPPEEARQILLSHVHPLNIESVPLLESIHRVAAQDLKSDITIAPFAHSAMDGFAMRSDQLTAASEDRPVALHVVAEVPAGDVYTGPLADDECVRIMTGAALPEAADSVVKYEIVDVVEGDGHAGSIVAFRSPTKHRSNVREAGEEATAGEVIVPKGDVISTAGIGVLAACGNMEVPTYRRPRVAIIATGSELVDPTEMPTPGKIRNSNSYALAACISEAGGIPSILPIVQDTYEDLSHAIQGITDEYDLIITTGGAANGDYDFVKDVLRDLGTLYITTVNMRPGKAQPFGIVDGTPVFGLPGNPAAAYTGFYMLIRPMLRKMQGYSTFDHSSVIARLTTDSKRKDPRRIYLRSTLEKREDGYWVTPAKNQSSGLFGVIQRTNCLAIMPEGTGSKSAGEEIECLLLDIPEELDL